MSVQPIPVLTSQNSLLRRPRIPRNGADRKCRGNRCCTPRNLSTCIPPHIRDSPVGTISSHASDANHASLHRAHTSSPAQVQKPVLRCSPVLCCCHEVRWIRAQNAVQRIRSRIHLIIAGLASAARQSCAPRKRAEG
jgi:hypothetical protein